jgi:AcrR family transcriptional regulator
VRARARLLTADGANASMRELAQAMAVSPPTLRHYFPTREALIEAVLARDHASALPYLHHIAAGDLPPLRESLVAVLGYILSGLVESELAGLHVLGLRAGLKSSKLGPAYLTEVLEPSLVALEARLQRHAARGELRREHSRLAALQLLSPLLMAVLHQRELGGDQCRPLELSTFVEPHVDAFIRAWSPLEPGEGPARGRRLKGPPPRKR